MRIAQGVTHAVTAVLVAMLLPAGSLYALGLKTDSGVYVEPELPVLPAAGGILIDPTFGTRIMRISDESDGDFNRTAYSNWPTFNVDSTRLHLMSDDVPTLYEFDPDTFTLGAKSQLWESEHIDWEDSIWSGIDPDVIYRREGFKLYSHNVETQQSTLLKDLSDSLPTEYPMNRLGSMSMSLDDNRFSFVMKPNKFSSSNDGYLVWDRAADEVIAGVVDKVHDAHLDKTGEYLLVKKNAEGPNVIQARVVDLENGTTTNLTDNGPDYAPGHYDLGHGTIIGGDNWRNGLTIRDAATPHEHQTIQEFPNWGQGRHFSLLADDEDWALVSSYSRNGVSDEFDNEIYFVATDGSGDVQRVAHHRSVYDTYWDTPRANISRDGRFIAFTSNWGGADRHDVFVVAVPGCILGDANCDGFVDISNDIFAAFNNFTGPGSFGMSRADGDVQGNATDATVSADGHDGDVDVSDIIAMFTHFTGPATPPALDEAHSSNVQSTLAAAEAIAPNIPDLIYNSATGEVILDADGASIYAYSLQNGGGSFLSGSHTPVLGGVVTSLPTELAEVGLSPLVGTTSIGLVLPANMGLAELNALLTTNQVSYAMGEPAVAFDLVVVGQLVPEPSTWQLSLVGMLLGLGAVRRVYRRRQT